MGEMDTLPSAEGVRQAFQAISRQALHDVQSPLAVIRMNARQVESYLTQAAQPTNAEAHAYVVQAVSHLGQAAQYIKDLLELFGACFQEIPQNVKETCVLRDCFERTFQSFPYKRPEDRQRVRYTLDEAASQLLLFAPRRQFILALQYLLRNTLRCTKNSGPEALFNWDVRLESEHCLHISGPFTLPSSPHPQAPEDWEATFEWDYMRRLLGHNGGALVNASTTGCTLQFLPLS